MSVCVRGAAGMAKLVLTVTQEQSGRSVLSLLKQEFALSTSCINRLKRTETGLTCNGQRVFTNARLQAGDVLAADPEAAERPSGIEPIPMPLSICYEDEHLLILDKSAPLAVIPSSLRPDEPTLANGLAHYLGEGFAFHPVNRLDRGTTGLMVVAKNGFIHDQLRRALHSGDFHRHYLAVCLGQPDPAEGDIDLPIGRDLTSAIRRRIDPDGQEARSHYRSPSGRRLALWHGGSFPDLPPRPARGGAFPDPSRYRPAAGLYCPAARGYDITFGGLNTYAPVDFSGF